MWVVHRYAPRPDCGPRATVSVAPAEQPGSGQQQAADEEPGKDQKAHANARDLGQQTEADDWHRETEIRRQKQPRKRFGAMFVAR